MSDTAAPFSAPARRFAVAVVHHHAPDALRTCLDSVEAQVAPPARVVVIDVGGGGAELLAEYGGVERIEMDNRGYAGAANRALDWAAGQDVEALLLLNADVELAPDHTLCLIEEVARHERVALAGGRLVRRDGVTLDSAGVELPLHRRPRDRGSEAPEAGAFLRSERVFGVSGAAMWIELAAARDLAIEGEVFDEDFFLYHEDTDLAWRAGLLGWVVLYVAQARARHERGWKRADRFRIAAGVRRHSFKNHYLQILKNERFPGALASLPAVLGWEVLRLAHALLRDPAVLPGYRAALRLAPRAWHKRRILQARVRRRLSRHRRG